MKALLLTLLLSICGSIFGQSEDLNPLKSGPMLGFSEKREAAIWLQTKMPSEVYIQYAVKNIENKSRIYITEKQGAKKDFANTVTFYLRNLSPGTTYTYSIWVNEKQISTKEPLYFKTQTDWEHRTGPPEFSFATGSCVYINDETYDRPGKPYGRGYSIFESIRLKKPDAMIWLGDNTYLRPADWTTKSGYLSRYTHTRSLPEMQNLLSSCNHYAIWDDHDFGPNDASGSWIKKDMALEVFKMFWANPSYGYADLPGIMTAFRYNDADFIFMDNRFNRTENFKVGEKHIFGEKQTERLINLLKYSDSPFKFVVTGGQFLNTAQVFENHANFSTERDYILKRIEEEDIEGVIFLSGDRHHSEVMKLDLENGKTIYEFTVSPLTSGTAGNEEEVNKYRVKGSFIRQQNFAIMHFSGAFGERKLEVTYFGTDGSEIYKFQIAQ
jgi:alkaline phosphatase D